MASQSGSRRSYRAQQDSAVLSLPFAHLTVCLCVWRHCPTRSCITEQPIIRRSDPRQAAERPSPRRSISRPVSHPFPSTLWDRGPEQADTPGLFAQVRSGIALLPPPPLAGGIHPSLHLCSMPTAQISAWPQIDLGQRSPGLDHHLERENEREQGLIHRSLRPASTAQPPLRLLHHLPSGFLTRSGWDSLGAPLPLRASPWTSDGQTGIRVRASLVFCIDNASV